MFFFFFSRSLYNPFVKEKDSLFLTLDDLSEAPEHRCLLRALTKMTWLKMSLLSAVGWTRSSLKVPPNPNSPVIYRTEAWLLDKEAFRETLNHGNLRWAALMACTALLHTESGFLSCWEAAIPVSHVEGIPAVPGSLGCHCCRSHWPLAELLGSKSATSKGQNESTTKSQASQLRDMQDFSCGNAPPGWLWLARIGMSQVNHCSLLSLHGAAPQHRARNEHNPAGP